MGYIGLLLNAPYKIDRLMWMRFGYISFLRSLYVFVHLIWLYEPGGDLSKKDLK
jgi:hypothetical protein